MNTDKKAKSIVLAGFVLIAVISVSITSFVNSRPKYFTIMSEPTPIQSGQFGFRIEPAKVYISGLYPGANVDLRVKISNGEGTSSNYTTEVRQPDILTPEYTAHTSKYKNWISCDETTAVPSLSEEYILLKIRIPEEVSKSERIEAWMSTAEDISGKIRHALACKIFLSISETKGNSIITVTTFGVLTAPNSSGKS